MNRTLLCNAIALLCVSGCSEGSRRVPTAPSPSPTSGATLKVSAPVLLSPPHLAVFAPSSPLVLRVENVRGLYAPAPSGYQVELWNPSGTFRHHALFVSNSATRSEFGVQALVQAEVPLRWRVRAASDEHFGPWSEERSLRVQRAAIIAGTGSTMERGEAAQLTVRSVQQGITSACVGTDWTSDRPELASVSPAGTVTAHRLGVVTISARCEASPGSWVLTVIETWRADFRLKTCRLVVGTGRACWNSNMVEGTSNAIRLELTEDGTQVAGDLTLPGMGAIPFVGTISPDNRLSGSGRKVTCGEGRTFLALVEVRENRVDWRIREADGLTCSPGGPFDREWHVIADIDRLTR
jgi:hypothetical protein